MAPLDPAEDVCSELLQARDPVVSPSKPRLLGILGPGLITGASDDDPSGIATYSQAGAQMGFGSLWMMLFSYPLMAVTQEISARIGRTTGHGLAGTLRRHYPPWLVQICILLLVIANVINLGADLGAMGDTAALLIGGPEPLYVLLFGTICVSMQILLQVHAVCRGLEVADVGTVGLFRDGADGGRAVGPGLARSGRAEAVA